MLTEKSQSTTMFLFFPVVCTFKKQGTTHTGHHSVPPCECVTRGLTIDSHHMMNSEVNSCSETTAAVITSTVVLQCLRLGCLQIKIVIKLTS